MVEEADVLPKLHSDHNAVIVKFKLNRNPKGKGYWRFPDALLENDQYISFYKR